MEYNVRFLEKRRPNGIGCKLVPLDWTVGKGAKILEILKPYPKLRVDASILSIGGMRVGRWEHKRIIDRLNNAEFPINVRLRIKEDYFKRERPKAPGWKPYFRNELLGCPGKHDLKWFRTPRNGYKCDSCRNFHFKNEPYYDCFECYFLVCEKCVMTAKTGGDPRIKASSTKEDIDQLIPQVKSITEKKQKDIDWMKKVSVNTLVMPKKPGHRKSRSALDDIMKELDALGPIITPEKKPKPNKRSRSDMSAVLDSRASISKTGKGWMSVRSSSARGSEYMKNLKKDYNLVVEREDSGSSSSMNYLGRSLNNGIPVPGAASPNPSRSSSPSVRPVHQRKSRLIKKQSSQHKASIRTHSQPPASRRHAVLSPFTRSTVDNLGPMSVSLSDDEDPLSKMISEMDEIHGTEKVLSRVRNSFVAEPSTDIRHARDKLKRNNQNYDDVLLSSTKAPGTEENKEEWESKVKRARHKVKARRIKSSQSHYSGNSHSSRKYGTPTSSSSSMSRTDRRERNSTKLEDPFSLSMEPRSIKTDVDLDIKPEKTRSSTRSKRGHRRSSSFSASRKDAEYISDFSLDTLDFDSGSSSKRKKKRRNHKGSKNPESQRFSREPVSSRKSSYSENEDMRPLQKVQSLVSRAKQLERNEHFLQAYRAWSNAGVCLEKVLKRYDKPRDVERFKAKIQKFRESAKSCKRKDRRRQQKKSESEKEGTPGKTTSPSRKSRRWNKADAASMSTFKYRQKISFRDIAGLETVKYALYESILIPVLNADDEIYRDIFAPPKGVLLFGHEGSGKTTLALSLAIQGNIPLVNLALKAVINSESPRHKLRDYFNKAREYPTSMIFIDDLQVLAPTRRKTDEMKERSEELRTITKELIGRIERVFKDHSSSVFIVSATRSPELLDKDLVRRFSCKLHVPAPTACGRAAVIYNLLKTRKHHLTEKDFLTLGEKTTNFNRYDLVALTREAIVAAHKEAVEMSDFQNALRNTAPTLDEKTIRRYERWNDINGTIASKDQGTLPSNMLSEADQKFLELKAKIPSLRQGA